MVLRSDEDGDLPVFMGMTFVDAQYIQLDLAVQRFRICSGKDRRTEAGGRIDDKCISFHRSN